MGAGHGHRPSSEKKHRLEDLVVPVDYLLDRAYTCNIPLSVYLVDLENAFNTVNWVRLLEVLQDYGVNPDMLEVIRHLYINTRGYIAGDNEFFCSTMGVWQGCPLSPLLFGLCFDHVMHHIKDKVGTAHMLKVHDKTLAAALYADDMALLAPQPTSQ